MSNPGGRPPLYNDVTELQWKIDDYFENPPRKKKIYVKDSKGDLEEREVPIFTITGLALHLGFADRHSFYDYEKREEFSHTIKKARTFIEREYEEMLTQGNVAGAIFALKNFGWKDQMDLNNTHAFSEKTFSLLSDLRDSFKHGGNRENTSQPSLEDTQQQSDSLTS